MKTPCAAYFCLISLFAAPAYADVKPNILWITAEDMSPALGAYGDTYATTPHLDALAKESVRYTNAFAAAPICSPSRSTLITGMWAPSLGTSQMRSSFPIPFAVKGFPTYLREAGYFTTNNEKTDYNTANEPRLIKDSWDESGATAHWRSTSRKKEQPFFAVFNQMETHQSRSMVWPYEVFKTNIQSRLPAEQIHDPAQAVVPPYYPDSAIVRREIARFYDCVTVMDAEVGKVLKQLAEDGLAENTIVFFYSDHGSGMPRHKRLLHNSGMNVPLMIRFPEKFKHLSPSAAGETVDRLVTFVDFAPSLLSMLNIAVPEAMQGKAFLGPAAAEKNEYLYGFRDRVDEVFDLSRSIRSDRYLYIRNYMPHLSWMQPSVYSDLGAIQNEIRQYATANAAALTPAQRAYAGPTRPVEEFYDVSNDAQNLVNLINGVLSPEQTAALEAHRSAFAKKRMEILDLGVLPESIMTAFILEEERPIREITLGDSNHRPDLETIWAAADLVGKGTREELRELVRSGDDAVRFWGIIGLRSAFPRDKALLEDLYDSMDDVSVAVRLEMAAWMAEASDEHRGEAIEVIGRELFNENWWTALHACRSAELLGLKAQALLPVMETLYNRHRHAEGDGSHFLAFSSGAFLQKMGMPTEPWDFSPKPKL